MLLDDENNPDEVSLRCICQKLEINFQLDVSRETVRKAIIKELKYSYKKVYNRSYEIDDVNITATRFWLAFEMFKTGYYNDKYII